MKGFNRFLSLIFVGLLLFAVTISSACKLSDLKISNYLGGDKNHGTAVVVTDGENEDDKTSDDDKEPETEEGEDEEEQTLSVLPDNIRFYKYYGVFSNAQSTLKLDVTSEEMFIAYIDYVNFYAINTEVELTLKYDCANFKEECKRVSGIYGSGDRLTIGCETGMKYYEGTKKGCYYVVESDGNKLAAKILDKEKEHVSAQVDYALKMTAPNTRAEDFDGFKLNSATKAISNVSNSEQLRWAIQNGYKPECINNSSAEKVLNAAKTVLRSIIDDEMDDMTKLRAIYEWLALNVQYDNYAASAEILQLIENKEIKASEYDSWYAEGVFFNAKAVCEGYAKALIVLAGLEGIPAIMVTGNGHAWNRVLFCDKWYVIDATHADVHVNSSEVFSYSSFMITDAEKERRGYVSGDYAGCRAETEFDIFSEMKIEVLGQKQDLVVESQAELIGILQYAKSRVTVESTVDVSVKADDVGKVELWKAGATLLFSKTLEPDFDINGNAHYTFFID